MPRRTDANQTQIVDALRQMGATVFVTSSIGRGFPDIVMSYKGTNYLIEIKDGAKPKSQQKLTKAEEEFHDKWQSTVQIMRSVDEAVDFISKLSKLSTNSVDKFLYRKKSDV